MLDSSARSTAWCRAARFFWYCSCPCPTAQNSAGTKATETGEALVTSRERDAAVERLSQDLASTKLYLQTLLEERDAKNQELVSAQRGDPVGR